jgi:16S rRNA processing protein RimM
MAPDTTGLVLVGEVTKPHGIRGEVCVALHADSSDFLAKGRTVLLRAPRPGAPVVPATVRASRAHKGCMLALFDNVPDRNRAEEMRGLEVYVREADLPELDEDEIYLRELEGLDVLLPDGQRLGRLSGFSDPGGQELWEITTDSGKEVLLPATPEFVIAVDLEAGTVTVDPPPGLLDLYL